MSKVCKVLLSVLLLLSFAGCRKVVVTSADELTFSNWKVQTKSGMSAILEFSDNQASFKVFDCNGKELSCIQGAFAVDEKNLYITDSELYKTYTFGYTVYGDKIQLEYLDNMLDFYPFSSAYTTVESNEFTE